MLTKAGSVMVVIGLLPLKPWFDTAVMPNLFCLTAMEMACTNNGGDHEVV